MGKVNCVRLAIIILPFFMGMVRLCPMAITPQFKDELRNRLRLSDVIGKRVKLQRAGGEFKGCCPFHSEKTPSFTVNDQKQFYHCFGCGAHGDVITFTMQNDNLPFMEAMERLAAEAGMSLPKPTPQEQEKYKKFDRLLACSQAAAKWFQGQLNEPRNKEIKNYALERGLSEETIEKFRIGYAPGDRDKMVAYLKEQGFSDEEMVEASLARKNKSGSGSYAFFRDRLMFPVTDGRGRIIAFGGRILPDHLKIPEKGDYVPAKYMNSSDTILFHKGRMVFNESLARELASQGEPLFITEGYMDVIALSQAGFGAAVAPLGTALTEDQIKLVWSMIPGDVKEPFICFDGDEAGKRAAYRAVERILPLLGAGQSARFIFMPQGEDPDSLIKKGGAKSFERCYESALPLIDVIWKMLSEGQQFDTPERKAALDKSITEMTGAIADKSVQYHYRQALRERMRMLNRPAYNKNNQYSQKGRAQARQNTKQVPLSKAVRALSLESMQATFLYSLCYYPNLIGEYEESLGNLDLKEPLLADARSMLMRFYQEEEGTLTYDKFRTWLEEDAPLSSLKEKAGIHARFLGNENLEIIEKGIKELLQNCQQHANFDSQRSMRLVETAQLLLKEKDA